MIDKHLEEEAYKDSIDEIDNILDDMDKATDNIKDYMQGVLNAIYVDGDVEDLENCLEEVLAVVGMNLPSKRPMLQKMPAVSDLAWHLGYQRGVIDASNNKGDKS